MEDEKCKKQTPIQFRCRKILPGGSINESSSAAIQTVKDDKKEDAVSSFASPTPEKPEWSSKSKVVTSFARKKLVGSFQDDAIDQSAVSHEFISDKDSLVSSFSEQSTPMLSTSLKDKSVELPENYKALVNLFNRMESSIRLLHLRKKLPTFKNICTQVEVLTKRKFFCSHLAQMKHVFSEAIQIEKILMHDEKSLCMNPDMKITLLFDIVECTHPEQSKSVALCQAFHARLLDFFNTNPEGTDIPEAMLPEPFNPSNQSLFLKSLPDESSSGLPPPTFDDTKSMSSASHFPSSFWQQFSQEVIVAGTQRCQLLATTALMESISIVDEVKGNRESPQQQYKSCSVSTVKASAEVISTPNRDMVSHHSESTPAKAKSNSDDVITETPAQQTPKRPLPRPCDKMVIDNEETVSEFRLTSSARRSLIYSPSKSEGSTIASVVTLAEQNRTIQYSSHQAGKEFSGSLIAPHIAVHNIAAGTIEDDKANQIGQGKRQEMLAFLLDIFDTICIISRTTDCSLITKQELVHKILSNNLEIEETREVEEQLGLLEELVPDWICKKAVSSGDFLYCIKQTSDPKSIRTRLIEAA